MERVTEYETAMPVGELYEAAKSDRAQRWRELFKITSVEQAREVPRLRFWISAIERGEEIPPIKMVIRYDVEGRETRFLLDGFHRIVASKLLGHPKELKVKVRQYEPRF
jgi:hypothetical protein